MAEGKEYVKRAKKVSQDESSSEEEWVVPELQVTEEEKAGTIPGSEKATEMARGMSVQPINPMGRYQAPKPKKKKKDKSDGDKKSDKAPK